MIMIDWVYNIFLCADFDYNQRPFKSTGVIADVPYK